MAINKAQDSESNPDLGKITSVEDAVKMFGPDVLEKLATMLAPMLAQQNVQSPNVRKLYEVEPYTGQHQTVEMIRTPLLDPDGTQVVDDKGKKKYTFVEHRRTVSGGYMVYLPQGNSIYVESMDQLKRLRLDAPGGLVDMSTGEAAVDPQESLKSRVARSTQHTPRSRHSGDGSRAGDITSVIAGLE